MTSETRAIDGLRFNVAVQGFRHHDTDAEKAVAAAWSMIDRLSVASRFALWAAARHVGNGNDNNAVADRLHLIEFRAIKIATRGWHHADDCHMSIAAMDPA